MEAALTGSYDEEQLFILRQSLEGWQFYQKQMEQCDQRIEKALAAIPKAPPAPKAPARLKAIPADAQASATKRPKRPQKGNNAPTIDFTAALLRICGTDLMKGCGQDRRLDRPFLPKNQGAPGTCQGGHGHRAQAGVCDLPHAQVSG